MSQLLIGPAAFERAAPESTLAVRVKFNAGVSPSIKNPNFRLHVWSDAPNRRAPYVEVLLDNDVDARAWHTFTIDSLDTAKTVFFEIHHDQWCDAESAGDRVVVPGQGRGKCAVALSKIPIVAPLVFEEFKHRQTGTVEVRTTNVGFWPFSGLRLGRNVQSELPIADVDTAVALAPELVVARMYGRDIGARSGPSDAALPATVGLGAIDVRYWDDPYMRTPGWFIMRWRARGAETPAFVSNALRITAIRKGLGDGDLERLARVAVVDASPSTAPNEQPDPETVRFAVLLAETALWVVSSAHYLADRGDGNTRGKRYNEKLVEPIEQFSSMIRIARSGDCEDFSKEVCEFYRGCLELANATDEVARAASLVASCYVPMMTLGQVYRPPSSDPQYNTGDGCNAHAWAMLVSASALEEALKNAPKIPGSPAPAEIDKTVCRMPWKIGLPTLVVDGTMTREMYPRVFAPNPERESLQKLPQAYKRAVGGLEWTRYMLPMNADFYKMIKTVFIPYGVQQFGRPVYALVFYCNIEKKKGATQFTRTSELRYGAPIDELFRLTHVAFDPVRSVPLGRSRPPTEGLTFAAAPTYVPTEDEMKHLDPLADVFHPLAPYVPPTPQDDAACRALEAAFSAELAAVGATVVASKPPFGTRAIVVRHRHAARTDKLKELARAMAGTWWSGRSRFVARVEAHSLFAGEQELSVWAWEAGGASIP